MYCVDHGKMAYVQGINLDTVDQFLSKEELFTGIDDADYAVRLNTQLQYHQHFIILCTAKSWR